MRTWLLVSGCVVVSVLCASAPAAAVPILVNGSLTGPIGTSLLPSGWVTLAGTPDTMDETHNLGSGVGFAATPSPSPDGGTWVGLATILSGSFYEAFGQEISGFTVGTVYDVSFDAANFGVTSVFTAANSIQLLVDGLTVASTPTIALAPGWASYVLSFTASAPTLTIGFRTSLAAQSYISIDGISLAEAQVTAVPEPATVSLLSLGLIGTVMRRRRVQRSRDRSDHPAS